MILITGGTGFIGRHVLQRLQLEKRPVRLLLSERRAVQWERAYSCENLRESLSGEPTEAPADLLTPEIVVGNILDEEALFRAMTGAHVVIHLENAQWWGSPRDLERIELEGARQLVTAARAARVGRIITVSHLGASSASAYPLLRYKGLVEETIRTSGLAYTILRSGLVFGEDDAFFNHIAMQLASNPLFYLLPGQGDISVHPLHIDDLVSAIVGSLDQLDTVDQTLEIGGPEYFTLSDVLRTMMRVTRQPRVLIPVPPYLLRALTAVYNRVLPRTLVTGQWLDLLAATRAARLGVLYSVFGIRPRRFEDTLLTYMRPRGQLRRGFAYTFKRRPNVLL